MVERPECFYIDGRWTAPSSDARIDVIDSGTEEVFLRVAEAQPQDMARAIDAARRAFDDGPWPRLDHAARAEHLRQLRVSLDKRVDDIAEVWVRESGIVLPGARAVSRQVVSWLDDYADLGDSFPFEEVVELQPGAGFGLRVREPVGVVGAIVPWNGPIMMLINKIAPALLAGCTVVVKLSPEAPGEGYLLAEAADQIGLPPGVLNVITADRAVSELLVTDARVDKISFTGSTAAGRRIASLCGERIARCTLELGGKSAAILLDDADLDFAAQHLASTECYLTGQVCSSLTRVIVGRDRHDELVEALAAVFADVTIGDPFADGTGMGPLAMRRQRDRVEEYVARGQADGARLAYGGGRPAHLDRGWYVEPTLFAGVDNRSAIAQEEIFGPVLCVIPAEDEEQAIRLANESPYGLNASVFTGDVERARAVASRIRSGTVGHNGRRGMWEIGAGGFKQSGIGREGGAQGVLSYLENKAVVLAEPTARYAGGNR